MKNHFLIASVLAALSGTANAAIVSPNIVTLNFNDMDVSAYYGKANTANGCDVNFNCYFANGFTVGTVADPNTPGGTNAHLHRGGTAVNYDVQYHADSPGIFFRADDLSAFKLDSLRFRAPIDPVPVDDNDPAGGTNPDTNGTWTITGFSEAIIPDLDTTHGVSYIVASKIVPNGTNNTAASPMSDFAGFENVKSIWIHWTGVYNTPSNMPFSMRLDNIQLSAPVAAAVPIPAAAWLFGSALAGIVSFRRKKKLA